MIGNVSELPSSSLQLTCRFGRFEKHGDLLVASLTVVWCECFTSRQHKADFRGLVIVKKPSENRFNRWRWLIIAKCFRTTSLNVKASKNLFQRRMFSAHS